MKNNLESEKMSLVDTSIFDTSVCLMYPVRYPDNRTAPPIEDLHSTVLWLGHMELLPDKSDLINILSDLPSTGYQWVDVKGLEFFGPEKNIPVLRLVDTIYLWKMYHRVSITLARMGVFSPSEFEYAPHVSLSYDPDFVPQRYLTPRVFLEPMELWYGDEKIRLEVFD